MNIDSLDVEKITAKAPSSGGAQRDVWFVGDLVIKKDQYEGDHYCEAEYENYCAYIEETKPRKFRFGREWGTIRFPEMTRVGDYIVAQRAKGEHLPYQKAECPTPECKNSPTRCPKFRKRGHVAADCWDCYLAKWSGHDKTCRYGKIMAGVEKYAAERLGLEDMHNENFLWDDATKTAWLIDIAE